MQLTSGRIVHIKNNDGDCRPAMVVRVWKNMGGEEGVDGFNGVAFRDGMNDINSGLGAAGSAELTSWVTSVVFGGENNQYHDPRECDNV